MKLSDLTAGSGERMFCEALSRRNGVFEVIGFVLRAFVPVALPAAIAVCWLSGCTTSAPAREPQLTNVLLLADYPANDLVVGVRLRYRADPGRWATVLVQRARNGELDFDLTAVGDWSWVGHRADGDRHSIVEDILKFAKKGSGSSSLSPHPTHSCFVIAASSGVAWWARHDGVAFPDLCLDALARALQQ